MFAPTHHGATRWVVPVRKELGVRTIFNFLGPLTNPAGARRQLIGLSDPAYLERMAGALVRLGVDRALVVSGDDGLDEISACADTRIVEVEGEHIERYTVSPEDFDLPRCHFDDVRGGTPQDNAAITRAVLDGESGPRRNLALLNAGAAVYAAGRAGSLAEGVSVAAQAVDSGAATQAMDAYVALSQIAETPAATP
jgi:anthranilate phosphoribosyltransferase